MPIFQEPPAELDESWTHGVLVGGMASESDMVELARAYVRAASELIPRALETREAWRYTYPILFLYRHGLELYLKAIVRPVRLTHDLRSLVQRLAGMAAWQRNQPLPADVIDDLMAYAKIDRTEESFRYTQTRDGRPLTLDGEYWVPLLDLKERMQSISELLERIYHDRQ